MLVCVFLGQRSVRKALVTGCREHGVATIDMDPKCLGGWICIKEKIGTWVWASAECASRGHSKDLYWCRFSPNDAGVFPCCSAHQHAIFFFDLVDSDISENSVFAKHISLCIGWLTKSVSVFCNHG